MIEIKIAKPCDQSWTAMKGDDQVRHCQRCQKNVFNISEMTEVEVRELIERTEGRFCARVYRRTDGRVMTKDCPKGVAAVRRRLALGLTTAFAAALYGVSFVRRQPTTFPAVKSQVAQSPVIKKIEPQISIGKPVAPVRMGEVMEVENHRMGRIMVIPKRKS